jgi:hypothetical protein
MDDFLVYKMYLALKLHFTSDNYDVIEQRGRIRASRKAFEKRKDLFSIRKIAKMYNDKEVTEFLVSNFVSGDRWGGVFDSEAGKRYVFWKKKTESLTYVFNSDLDKLEEELLENDISFQDTFKVVGGDHPYILKAYLRNTITLETFVILESVIKFSKYFDKNIKENIIWPDISRLVKKYRPFLNFNRDKYDELLRRRFGCNNTENKKH